MPDSVPTREQVIERILAEFRLRGYDASSLSDLSAATGLGRSSLYHHFPGGKGQMAADVLGHLAGMLEREVFTPLRSVSPAKRRLADLLDAIDSFYRGGRDACLLERLTASTEARTLAKPLRAAFRAMMIAFEETAREAGLSSTQAHARAEDAVIRIEGALVVSAGLGEPGPFERVMRGLRRGFLTLPDHD